MTGDVETRFDTWNYNLDRPLPKGKNKKVIGLMKEKLDGNIKTRFVRLREKAYSYLIEDGGEDKKAKGTKKRVIKKKIKFENYKYCFKATQIDDEINYLEKKKLT